MVAEQFGTLASLYPGRIDLGVGRAPGTDQITARALRRNLSADIDAFPQDVIELMSYFRPVQPGQLVRAIPGAGLEIPIWILGSSLYGAQLAAALGSHSLSRRISPRRRWSKRRRYIAHVSSLPINWLPHISCWG